MFGGFPLVSGRDSVPCSGEGLAFEERSNVSSSESGGRHGCSVLDLRAWARHPPAAARVPAAKLCILHLGWAHKPHGSGERAREALGGYIAFATCHASRIHCPSPPTSEGSRSQDWSDGQDSAQGLPEGVCVCVCMCVLGV